MLDQISTQIRQNPYENEIVTLDANVLGVQSPDGEFVSADTLGPGIVEQLGPRNSVRVRWQVAGFSVWLDTNDLRSLGANAHLLTIQRRDKHGRIKSIRHKVVTEMGLTHNWKVNMLPHNIVRPVRSDGACWTFTFNPLFQRIDTCWPQPRTDDDAEALAAADLSIR